MKGISRRGGHQLERNAAGKLGKWRIHDGDEMTGEEVALSRD